MMTANTAVNAADQPAPIILPGPGDGEGLDVCAMLDVLPRSAIQTLQGQCQWLRAQPDTTLVQHDAPPDYVYFLTSGKVRVCFRLPGKPEVILAELGVGEVFGELAALDGRGRSADVVAAEVSILAACPKAVFHDILRSYPELGYRFLLRFANIIRRSDTQIMRLAALTSVQRIFLELLRVSVPDVSGDGTWLVSPAPLHRNIAAWAGTTPEDVGRAIGHLMRASLIRREGPDLRILDRGRIELLAMMPSEDMYARLRAGTLADRKGDGGRPDQPTKG